MEIYKNLSLENLEGEIWRDIQDYDGKYQISNYGKVKSLRNKYGTYREKILKFGKTKDGYFKVALCKEGKLKTYLVHRLVANAFIDNPSNLSQVNHKNEIKTDNRVENLEWCDAKYNTNYGTCIQRRVEKIDYKTKVANTDYKAIGRKAAEKLRNRQDQSKRVYQYSLDGELVGIWQSTNECGRNGYTQSSVAACCRNCYAREGNNIYKNYIWSYTPIDSK